jgi:nucleoside-diphosphate-sugar epimerase
MSALVIGANGHIGFAVAHNLRQNGYKVYGLIRKQEQARKLAANEIIPVVGDSDDPSTYEHIVKQVENIIDASSSFSGQNITFALTSKISATSTHGKKAFILTSSISVQANSEEVVVSEEQTNNVQDYELLRNRAKLEAEVIASRDVHGIVIRPGVVYGYAGENGGMHMGDKAFQLSNGKIQITGSYNKRWSWVHVNDLARSYYLAIQNFTVASGQIFNVATRDPPTYLEFRKRAAEVAGHKNPEVVQLPIPEDDLFAKIMECSVRVSPKKAENLLGWFSLYEPVLDDLPNVYRAYLALKN